LGFYGSFRFLRSISFSYHRLPPSSCAASLPQSALFSCCSQLIISYLSWFLPFLRLFTGLRFSCAPGYGKTPSARLLSACRAALISIKFNPPRLTTGHDQAKATVSFRSCVTVPNRTHATSRPLLSESLRPSFASPSTASWRFQTLEFPLQPLTPVPKLSSGPPLSDQTQTRAPLSLCPPVLHS
jgi:hypothetical protein